MKLVAAKCPNCKANIDVDKNSDTTVCEYCGSKIIVDDAIAKYKLEVSGKVDVSNFTSFNKLIKLADKFFVEKNYKQSLDKYNKAIELEPDDLYVDYRINLIDLILNNEDEDVIINAFKKLSLTNYYYDDSCNKVEDISKNYFELLDIVFDLAEKCYESIKNNSSNTYDLIVDNVSRIQLYYYQFEDLYNNQSLSDSIKESLLVYLLDLIQFLSSGYSYNGHVYQDIDNLNLYKSKKNKFYNELIKMDDSYVGKFNYAIKKENSEIYNLMIYLIIPFFVLFIIYLIFSIG